jgi:hypothetical protein
MGHRRPGVTFLGAADLEIMPWHLYGNTCCAYRRSALERFPFDEMLPTAEDLEWTVRVVRAGFQIGISHRIPVVYRNRAPFSRYWRRGRTDLPTVARICGMDLRPSWGASMGFLLKDTAQLFLRRLPFWLWARLVVKRLGELSLRFDNVRGAATHSADS